MTPHFTLAEFTASDTADRAGIDNTLPLSLHGAALETLEMHERIRAFLSATAGRDVPIDPSSGYRCPALNWAVRFPTKGPGLDPTGDHPAAAAMDWRANSFGTPLEICRALAPMVSTLRIGQLILEYGRWVHASTRLPTKAINRVITINSAGTHAGIVGG